MPISKKEISPSQMIVIVALATALSLLGDSMLYIALPVFWKEASLDSIWQVGILLSINRFIRLPFNPVVGWVYKKIPLKSGLLFAVLLGGFTTLGYGLFSGFLAWVILRGLWGIAWSFLRIGGLSIVAILADESHRGKLMGLYNGLYRLGSLAGMLIGGIMVPIIGLKAVSIAFGFFTLLGVPLILLFLKSSDGQHQSESPEFREKSKLYPSQLKYKMALIATGFLITMLYQGVFTSTLSPVIERLHGQSIYIFGAVISVTLLSGLIQAARWVWEPFLGRLFGQWSDGSKGRLPLFAGSLLSAGLAFGLISSSLPLGVWLAIIFIVMISATSITTIMDAIALDASKNTNVVSFLTKYSIAQDVGAALGPFVGYMIIGLRNGFTYLYWSGAGVFILLGILWSSVYFFGKRIRHKREGHIHLH
ncbi:MFS transporter [Cytobacillus sp. NCCP-133]|uniref:MFS transporter n=1 Tax=Cytobacillus sp. NCCP-133 TaxID=766848 RepID=UPI00222F5A8B|nr:MFS transporter [Cytobacillus sp. NCCP-133]GLB61438.1 MFS transporter [Cytobacillus sp. NCCP-133]